LLLSLPLLALTLLLHRLQCRLYSSVFVSLGPLPPPGVSFVVITAIAVGVSLEAAERDGHPFLQLLVCKMCVPCRAKQADSVAALVAAAGTEALKDAAGAIAGVGSHSAAAAAAAALHTE
jgi:hypothetical protein